LTKEYECDDEGDEERRRRNKKKIRCLCFIISYNRSNGLYFKKRDQTIKIKRFNKVYGGLPKKLVHLRNLRLKTNRDDQNNNGRRVMRPN